MTDHNVTIYTVRTFFETSKPELPGHRLAVFKWKDGKKDDGSIRKALSPSLCISIPKIALEVKPECLKVALQAAFEDMQDSCLKEGIEVALNTKQQVISFTSENLTAEFVQKWASTAAISGRLSGDAIEKWFDLTLADPLLLALSNVLQIDPNNPEQEKVTKLAAAMVQHKTMLKELASPRKAMKAAIAATLLKAVQLDTSGSKVAAQLVDKLQTYITPVKEVELLMSL